MIYYILLCHWVADFVFQTKWMATNKGANIKPLVAHILEYFIVFMAMLVIPLLLGYLTSWGMAALYVLVNSGGHFIVDFCTSKITKFAYANIDKPWGNKLFWSCIGLDQFAHYVPLIALLPMLI